MQKLFHLLVLSVLIGSLLQTVAQGTAFTYQGRLNDGSNPANGNYDLRFAVYNAASVGSMAGWPVTNAATAVTNGLFTVTLDFGSGVFDGSARWLEIAVRTNGATSFATLTPRQPLTPVPYAILAGTASGLSGTLPVSQVSGVVPLAQLPAAVMTNYATGVSLSGSFTGNGSGLTGLNPANLNAGTAAINITGNAATATTAGMATNACNIIDGAGNVVGYSITCYTTNFVVTSWDTNHVYVSGFSDPLYDVTFTYVPGSFPNMTMYSNAITHAFIVWTNDQIFVGLYVWEFGGNDDNDSNGGVGGVQSGSPYDLASTNLIQWASTASVSLGTNSSSTNIVARSTNYFTGTFIGNGSGITNLSGSFSGSFLGNGSGITNLSATNLLDYYVQDYLAWRDLQAISIPDFNNYTPTNQTNSAAAFQNPNRQREILLLGTGLVGQGILNYVWQNPAVTNSHPIAGYGCMNIVDSTHGLGATFYFPGKDGYWLGPYTGTTNIAGTNRFWTALAPPLMQPWNVAEIDCAIGPDGSSWKLQTNSGDVNGVYVDTDMPVAVTSNSIVAGKSFYWTNPFGPMNINCQMVSLSGGTNRFLNIALWDSTIQNGLIINEQQTASSHPSQEIQNTNIMGVFMTNWNPCLILWESPEDTNTIGPLTNVISFCQYSCPHADIVLCGDYPMCGGQPDGEPDNVAAEHLKLQYAKQYNVAYFDGWTPFESTNNMIARGFYGGSDFIHASALGYQTYGYFLTRYLMDENFLPQTIPGVAPAQILAGNLPATVTNTAPVTLAQLPSAVLTNNQTGVTLSGSFTGTATTAATATNFAGGSGLYIVQTNGWYDPSGRWHAETNSGQSLQNALNYAALYNPSDAYMSPQFYTNGFAPWQWIIRLPYWVGGKFQIAPGTYCKPDGSPFWISNNIMTSSWQLVGSMGTMLVANSNVIGMTIHYMENTVAAAYLFELDHLGIASKSNICSIQVSAQFSAQNSYVHDCYFTMYDFLNNAANGNLMEDPTYISKPQGMVGLMLGGGMGNGTVCRNKFYGLATGMIAPEESTYVYENNFYSISTWMDANGATHYSNLWTNSDTTDVVGDPTGNTSVYGAELSEGAALIINSSSKSFFDWNFFFEGGVSIYFGKFAGANEIENNIIQPGGNFKILVASTNDNVSSWADDLLSNNGSSSWGTLNWDGGTFPITNTIVLIPTVNTITSGLSESNGVVDASSFIGSGSLLTNLQPSNIASGNLPATVTNTAPVTLAQLPSAVLTNNQPGVNLSGSFTGNGSALTNLNANNLASGTVPLARLSGITSNQLDTATWQLATNLNGGNAALASNVVSGIAITDANITNSVFAGNGSGLTNISGTLLAVNTLPVSGGNVAKAPANTWTKVVDLGSFTKLTGATIELAFNGRLAVGSWGSGASGADFELRLDNTASSVGRVRATVMPTDNNINGIQAGMAGFFTGYAAGSHTISLWVYGYNGSITNIAVNPGYYSAAHVAIKEYK